MRTKPRPKPGPKVDGQYARANARLKREGALWAADRPPPKEAAPALSAGEKAARLRDLGAAAYLYGAAAPVLGEAMDVEAWKRYVDSFVEELGVTKASGPIARMMGEQLALCHHAVGRLHVRAATRTAASEVVAYSGAIARLQAEFRRTAIALRSQVGGAGRRATVAPRTKARPPSGVRPARRVGKNRRTKVASNGNRIRGRIRGKHPVG